LEYQPRVWIRQKMRKEERGVKSVSALTSQF